MNKPVLILTRPESASHIFWEGLQPGLRSRLTLLISPLMKIVPTGAAVDLAGIEGVIFTSSNGVACAPPARQIPAFCIGTKTTDAARTAGWPARMMGQNADQLVANLLVEHAATPLLHLGGNHLRGDIAARLTQAGLPTRTARVYDQILQPMSTEAQAAICDDQRTIVPLFSPRTAEHFIGHCRNFKAVTYIALSDAVATPVRQAGAKTVVVANEPTSESIALQLETVLNWDRLT